MKSKFTNTLEIIYTILMLLSGILIIIGTAALDMEAYWYLLGVVSIIWGIIRLVRHIKDRKEIKPEE